MDFLSRFLWALLEIISPKFSNNVTNENKKNIFFGLQTVTKSNTYSWTEINRKNKTFLTTVLPLLNHMRHFRFSVSPRIAPYNEQDLNHFCYSKRIHKHNRKSQKSIFYPFCRCYLVGNFIDFHIRTFDCMKQKPLSDGSIKIQMYLDN